MDENGIQLDIGEVLRYLGVKDDPEGATARAVAPSGSSFTPR